MPMVDDLLFIKRFRESKAETELQKSRAALVLAQKAEREAEQALEAYIAHAIAQEKAWYDDLCSRLVKLREIATVQEDVAALKVAERAHREQVDDRRKAHVEAGQQMDRAVQRMRDASTARQKFVELARNFHWLAAREQERKEELELEELASIRREREDWEAVDA
jgi:type III secretion protein O